MCGIIDDCGPNACRNGNCVDKVNGNKCDCDEDYELMLPVNDALCVAKEIGTFSLEHGEKSRREHIWKEIRIVIFGGFVQTARRR